MRVISRDTIGEWYEMLGALLGGRTELRPGLVGAGLPVRQVRWQRGSPRERSVSFDDLLGDEPILALVGDFGWEPIDRGILWTPVIVLAHRRPDGAAVPAFAMTAAVSEHEPYPRVVRMVQFVPLTHQPKEYKLMAPALQFLRTLGHPDVRVALGLA
jgi:hypothetical protein